MNSLPIEIHLNIHKYLEKHDQFSWSYACRRWYTEIIRNHHRILTIHMDKWNTVEKMETLKQMIPRMIRDASRQLEICSYSTGHKDFTVDSSLLLFQLLGSVNYSISKLSCSTSQIVDLIAIKPDIRIKATTFDDISPCNTTEEKHFLAFQHLEAVSLIINDGKNFGLGAAPRVQQLTITNLSHFPHRIFSQLQILSLWKSSISDVSMLGYIPDLTLDNCFNVTDISALNHNRKIKITDCSEIFDYSRSFENSEVIDLSQSYETDVLILNVQHWTKVKELSLYFYEQFSSSPVTIPLTTRKLTLRGDTIPDCRLDITNRHCLREIKLAVDDSITSLADLGFERLVIIELSHCSELSSLQGLGSGKNQKVIVKGCPFITDYSPLRYVHHVEIGTFGKVNLAELDHVCRLTIEAKELIIDSNRRASYNIYELDISRVEILKNLNGLERIPSLTSSEKCLSIFGSFLSEGGNLFHDKLVIQRRGRNSFAYCRFIFDQYLCNDYRINRETKNILILLRNSC